MEGEGGRVSESLALIYPARESPVVTSRSPIAQKTPE